MNLRTRARFRGAVDSTTSSGQSIRQANPDIWRDENGAPPYAAWEGLGPLFRPVRSPRRRAGRLPHSRLAGRRNGIGPAREVAGSRRRRRNARSTGVHVGTPFLVWSWGRSITPSRRGGYPSISGGGVGGGGSGGGAGGRGASGRAGMVQQGPGADAAGEGPTGPILKGYVYRSGGPNPGNLKAEPGQDLSARDTFSNPYPPPEGRPILSDRRQAY